MTRRNRSIQARACTMTFVLAAALAVPQVVLAASACKGLEKRACEAKDSCYWVDGYTRKDGVKVSSHCRSAPKKKPASSTKQQNSG